MPCFCPSPALAPVLPQICPCSGLLWSFPALFRLPVHPACHEANGHSHGQELSASPLQTSVCDAMIHGCSTSHCFLCLQEKAAQVNMMLLLYSQ